MLVCGFLLGAYATALDVEATNWALFLPGAAVALSGVVLSKRHERGEAKAAHVLTANRAELGGALDRIVGNLDRLIDERQQLPTGELLHRIDKDLRDDLRRFADARESMVHLYGIQAYADIMSDFASGERYVNRVWSASADGYGEEASDYLARAAAEFRHARDQLASAESGASA